MAAASRCAGVRARALRVFGAWSRVPVPLLGRRAGPGAGGLAAAGAGAGQGRGAHAGGVLCALVPALPQVRPAVLADGGPGLRALGAGSRADAVPGGQLRGPSCAVRGDGAVRDP